MLLLRSKVDLNDVDGRSNYSTLSEKSPRGIEVPRVEPLLSGHLDNAFESVEAAFKDNPVALYLKAGKERSPFEQDMYKRVWKYQHEQYIKRKVAYTVNAGDAVIIATPPEEDIAKPSPIERSIEFIADSIWNFFLWANRRQEQEKRFRELQTKARDMIDAELGERIKSMVLVDLLATKPEFQDRGYGTALLKTVLFSADIKGRPVWLTTSDIANVPFYESFGFVKVAQLSLGEDNPKWESPPITVPLMVREAKLNV